MINEYEAILKSAKELVKAQKALDTAHSKSVDYRTMTQAQIGKRSDTMTRLAFDKDKALENIHADLVDAGLTEKLDNYDTRLITHSHGCGGHTYTFKHTPKTPKNYIPRIK